jgi:RNA polymerase sigma-70 factor, ECF subfamily
MQHHRAEQPTLNHVTAVFDVSTLTFELPRAATYAELADRLAGLSERYGGAPSSVDVRVGPQPVKPGKPVDETTAKEATPEFRAALVDSIPHLRAFARSLTRNGDRADDLVHDAAVRALAAFDKFSPGTNFKAWIFVILRNLFYNQGRKGHWRNVPLDELTAVGRAIPATQEVALEFCDFRRAFSQLGDDRREVLMLIGASGLSYEEAAKVCNCAVGTIKSRASRAREELTRLLSEGRLTSRAEFAPVAQMELSRSGRIRQSERPRLGDGATLRQSRAAA